MTQSEFEVVDSLEKEIVKNEKSGVGEFINKVKSLLSMLGKGKLVEFISTRIVELAKEIKDVALVLKEIKEDIAELKKERGK